MNKEFQVHALNASGRSKARQIAETFDARLDKLASLCPPGRELAIVRTKLEEASFFAKKAMACQVENQESAPCHRVVGFEVDGCLVFVGDDNKRYTSGERLADYGPDSLTWEEIRSLMTHENLSEEDYDALRRVIATRVARRDP